MFKEKPFGTIDMMRLDIIYWYGAGCKRNKIQMKDGALIDSMFVPGLGQGAATSY